MFVVDSEKKLIALTRGDTAMITFSAVDSDGNQYEPEYGDELKLSVAKKYGASPLFEITNIMNDDAEAFWGIVIGSHNTKNLRFGDYVFDVQLKHGSSVDTIIGKTDDCSPTFRVWDEVSTEE